MKIAIEEYNDSFFIKFLNSDDKPTHLFCFDQEESKQGLVDVFEELFDGTVEVTYELVY